MNHKLNCRLSVALPCALPRKHAMSGVVDLMNDGEDSPLVETAAAAPAAAPPAAAAAGPAKEAHAASASSATAKHAGEMELETPFVEKYRPMFVSCPCA